MADGGAHPDTLAVVQGLTFTSLLWLTVRGRVGWVREPLIRLLFTVIAFVLAAAVVSTAGSEDFGASVVSLLEWLWLASLALLTVSFVSSSRKRELVVALLTAAVVMQVLWSLYVWWGGRSPFSLHVGTFYAPNQYAGYLLLLAPVILSIYFLGRGWLRSAGFGLLASLVYLSISWSGSRGGAVAASAGVVAVAIMAIRVRGRLAAVRLLIVVLLFLGIGQLLPRIFFPPGVVDASVPGVATALAGKQGGATTVMRVRWAQGALKIGLGDPLSGAGLGTFGDKFFQIQDPSWQWSAYAHNEYLEALAEGGVPLFFGFSALVAIGLFAGAKLLSRDGISTEEWSFGLWAGTFGGALHLGVDHDWSYPAYSAAFVVAAVLLISRLSPKAPMAESRPSQLGLLVGASLCILVLVGLVTSRALTSGAVLGGRSPEARGDLASSVAPYVPEPRVMVADALVRSCDRGGFMLASRELQMAAALDRLDPVIVWKQAIVFEQLSEFDDARAAYGRALQIVPNSPEAYLRAALFERRLGEVDRSNRILSRGIERLSRAADARIVQSIPELLTIYSRSDISRNLDTMCGS